MGRFFNRLFSINSTRDAQLKYLNYGQSAKQSVSIYKVDDGYDGDAIQLKTIRFNWRLHPPHKDSRVSVHI